MHILLIVDDPLPLPNLMSSMSQRHNPVVMMRSLPSTLRLSSCFTMSSLPPFCAANRILADASTLSGRQEPEISGRIMIILPSYKFSNFCERYKRIFFCGEGRTESELHKNGILVILRILSKFLEIYGKQDIFRKIQNFGSVDSPIGVIDENFRQFCSNTEFFELGFRYPYIFYQLMERSRPMTYIRVKGIMHDGLIFSKF